METEDDQNELAELLLQRDILVHDCNKLGREITQLMELEKALNKLEAKK